MISLKLCESPYCRACWASGCVSQTPGYCVLEKVTSDLGSLFRGCGTGYEDEG